MKKYVLILAALMVLMFPLSTYAAHSGGHSTYAAHSGGHSGWTGHHTAWHGYYGGYHGGHYGGHYWGPHFYWGGSFVLGPWWYPWYPYYGYGYAAPYYGYAAPRDYAQQPQVYVDPQQTQQNYWYFCQDPQGYYPYVKNCPGGWMKVTPQPAPPSQPAPSEQ